MEDGRRVLIEAVGQLLVDQCLVEAEAEIRKRSGWAIALNSAGSWRGVSRSSTAIDMMLIDWETSISERRAQPARLIASSAASNLADGALQTVLARSSP